MSKIFIDCGTHLFQGFEQFAQMFKIDKDWNCFCFEPNPYTYEKARTKYNDLSKNFQITFYPIAVSNYTGYTEINCAKEFGVEEYVNQGSNILSNPPSCDKVYGGVFDYTKVPVKSIRLVDFIKDLSGGKKFGELVVKLDIEGSEFDVIEDLIQTETYKYINHLYVEFHERFFDDVEYKTYQKQEWIKFFENTDTKLVEWH